MRAFENVAFKNISATPATFTLRGGNYLVEVTGTFGTVTLNRLSMDGSTWVACLTAFSANGVQLANLGPGSYQLALAGAGAVYAEISRIPGD
jgi:hypothetical protein